MNDKEELLSVLDEQRLRSLAETWGHEVEDRRLRAPGLAKALARKRSLTVGTILAAMNRGELAEACRRVGLSATGTTSMRHALEEGLARAGWKALRRETAASSPMEMVSLAADLLEVIDGDTLRVSLEGEEILVRIRGIDTPETSESDKAEEDLDRTKMARGDMRALGGEATERVRELVRNRKVFLQCQRTPLGPKTYLHHRQYRLLAFVMLDASDGPDLGKLLLAGGHALVWPRNLKTRRYLHPKSDEYIFECNKALRSKPGLWRKGLWSLCPQHQHRARPGWTLDDCRASCLPASGPKEPERDEAEA